MENILKNLVSQPQSPEQMCVTLKLVVKALEEERKIQEELRRTKEIELEILRFREHPNPPASRRLSTSPAVGPPDSSGSFDLAYRAPSVSVPRPPDCLDATQPNPHHQHSPGPANAFHQTHRHTAQLDQRTHFPPPPNMPPSAAPQGIPENGPSIAPSLTAVSVDPGRDHRPSGYFVDSQWVTLIEPPSEMFPSTLYPMVLSNPGASALPGTADSVPSPFNLDLTATTMPEIVNQSYLFSNQFSTPIFPPSFDHTYSNSPVSSPIDPYVDSALGGSKSHAVRPHLAPGASGPHHTSFQHLESHSAASDASSLAILEGNSIRAVDRPVSTLVRPPTLFSAHPAAASSTLSAPTLLNQPSASRPPLPLSKDRESAISRKAAPEEDCICERCREKIATRIIHMDWRSPEGGSGHYIELVCNRCEDPRDLAAPGVVALTNKKKRALDDNFECNICKRRLGRGGIRSVEGSKPIENREGRQYDSPDMKIEIVCNSCKERYRFCTECGGGGKFRTGKYRPVDLFPAGRRTCRLTHVRLSGASVTIVVYKAPQELTNNLLEDTHGVHIDGFYGLYAAPEIMESSTMLQNFASIHHEAEGLWDRAEALLRKESEQQGCRRYLSVAYMSNHHGKVRGATKKKISAKETGAGPSYTGTSPSDPAAPSASSPAPPSLPATDRIQVAYSIAQWDKSKGALFYANGYVRTTTISTLNILRELDERILDRAQAEAAQPCDGVTYPPITILWLLVRNEHVRLQAYFERMGFRLLADFMKSFPDTDQSIFEREVHVPRELFLTMVTTVSEFKASGVQDRLKGSWR
ncbi:uncharacterized protein BJ171DRAFT_201179 [Polychytrium aggregatum]|uniref:uncharacterized protein n=1 Tax=Polychytrium aggregatum TaxID=110093 RepID=UPI0022FDE6FF|nr:uncharacterized protein BJ171DRAFT_201179 [Polychytrium aggregatum]KAI9199699.1 hypothetical protein BJ171DRAFT_201179 [Polychytrium aggregatum]